MIGDSPTQDWVNLAESNIFGILFRQGYLKKKDPTIVLSLTMSNSGFDHANFINEANIKGYE